MIFDLLYIIDSTTVESEISKYIYSFVSSQLEILVPHYEMMKIRLLNLLSVDGLSDQIQSQVIKSLSIFSFFLCCSVDCFGSQR